MYYVLVSSKVSLLILLAALKKDSRGLSRGAAGNPRFPLLLPGTLGNLPGCL